jgi:hypothetical protein
VGERERGREGERERGRYRLRIRVHACIYFTNSKINVWAGRFTRRGRSWVKTKNSPYPQGRVSKQWTRGLWVRQRLGRRNKPRKEIPEARGSKSCFGILGNTEKKFGRSWREKRFFGRSWRGKKKVFPKNVLILISWGTKKDICKILTKKRYLSGLARWMRDSTLHCNTIHRLLLRCGYFPHGCGYLAVQVYPLQAPRVHPAPRRSARCKESSQGPWPTG